MKAGRYFSKFPFQISLTGQSNHVKHINFEHTQNLKSNMKEYADFNRDISIHIISHRHQRFRHDK